MVFRAAYLRSVKSSASSAFALRDSGAMCFGESFRWELHFYFKEEIMKSKKILSLMLALCIALTVCGVGAVAVTAAPADHSGVIYFDAASAGWEKSEKIMRITFISIR